MTENSDAKVQHPGERSSAGAHNSGDLEQWASELASALGLAAVMRVDVDAILALAGDAARAIVRPAAPLTTFIVGFAAGRGSLDGSLDAATATEIARALAQAAAATAGAAGAAAADEPALRKAE